MPTYIDISAWPYTHTVTTLEFNGPPNEVWFRFTAPAGTTALGWRSTLGSLAETRVYDDASGSPGTLLTSGTQTNAFWYLPLTGGGVYYIHLRKSDLTSLVASFDVFGDNAPVNAAIPAGTRLINDDSNGFAATLWSGSTFLGFSTNVPAGETGDALPSGMSLWHAAFASSGSRLVLLAGNLSIIAVTDTTPTVGSISNPLPLIANDRAQFWVLRRNGGANTLYTVSTSGGVSGILATIPGGPDVSAIGVSTGGSILYWAEGNDSPAIHRHDLGADTPLSDLYSIPELATDTGTVARAVGAAGGGGNPGEILVLADGSIVTWYRNDTDAKDVLIHVSAAGTLLHSYTYTHPVQVNHIAYHPTDPAAIAIWFYLDAPTPGTLARSATLDVSTGTLSDVQDLDQFSQGFSLGSTPTSVFGPSSSCTLIMSGGGAAPVVPPIVNNTPPCPCPSPPGSPTTTPNPFVPFAPTYSCTGGGTVEQLADLPGIGGCWL